MEDRLTALESRVQELSASERTLLERLQRLEEKLAHMERALPAPAPEIETALTAPDAATVTGVVSLLGRALVVLGGAYLLRALTESGALPRQAGMGLGLVYALSGLYFAHRAAKGGQSQSAVGHGLTSAAIAYPLLWEGALRTAALGAIPAAVGLGGFAAACLFLAWRHQLSSLAWAGILPAGGSALLLIFKLESFEPFAVLLMLLLPALLLLTRDRWTGLKWAGAAGFDVAMAVLVIVAAGPRRPQWFSVTALTVVLVLYGAMYLISFVFRAVSTGAPGVFEVVQGVAVLAAGLEGALQVSPAPALIGALALATAAALYALSFKRLTDPPSAAAWYLTAMAAALALEGVRAALPLSAALAAWAVLGLGAAALSARPGGVLWCWQAALFATVCALASSLPGALVDAFTGDAGTAWRSGNWTAWLALAVCAGACVLMLRPSEERRTAWWRIPPVVALALALLGAGALLVSALAGPIAGVPSGDADLGLLASVRTGVVAAMALVLALLGRRTYRELAWLVYPLLLLGGLKLLLEDVARGRPATMFISLVLFGGALVGAPWVLRREVRKAA